MIFSYCVACGSNNNLENHHIVPRAEGGGDEKENLITLCHACHDKIHGMLRKPTGLLVRKSIYNIDPELFDERFRELWETNPPSKLDRFRQTLQVSSLKPPTGGDVWLYSTVRNHASRLGLKITPEPVESKKAKYKAKAKKKYKVRSPKSNLAIETKEQYDRALKFYKNWATTHNHSDYLENPDTVISYIKEVKLGKKLTNMLLGGIARQNQLDGLPKITRSDKLKEFRNSTNWTHLPT